MIMEILKSFSNTLNLNYDEQDRIKDIIQKHGGVNWKDALGSSQLISKLELTDELSKVIEPQSNIVLIGGWVGLIPYLMNLRGLKCNSVVNIEIDQNALLASDFLNYETIFNYERLFEDALNVEYERWSDMIIINTSCEHLPNYAEWIDRIPSGTRCILQSNNMFGLPEHVNCHKDLHDFESHSGLQVIQGRKEIDIGDGWNRFMISGIR
jgi:hypothetical protein